LVKSYGFATTWQTTDSLIPKALQEIDCLVQKVRQQADFLSRLQDLFPP